MGNFRWYAVQTKPKKERQAEIQLARARFETFLPQMQGVIAPKPLFPGYLFVFGELSDSRIHRLIRYTRGVSRVLGDADAPRPISDEIIATLKEKTRDGSLIERDLLFQEGDPVLVKRGLLKDLQGIIEKNLSDLKRVKVLFKWLNTSLTAVVNYQDLEKAA